MQPTEEMQQSWIGRYGPIAALGLYLLIFGIAAWQAIVATDFHVVFNDFWGTYFMASHMEFGRPETFYNGFHPIGYPLTLRLFAPDDPIRFGFAFSLVLGLLMLGGFGIITAPILGRWLSVLAVVALSLFPIMFRYTITPGSDIGCVAFVTLGWALLARTAWRGRWHPGVALAAGCLFGLSAIWRQHGLVLVIACVLVVAFTRWRDWRFLGALAIGFFAVYSAQIAVNLTAGRGALETAQSFNLYRNMYGINWWNIPEDIPSSIPGLIVGDLKRFSVAYLRSLSSSWPVVLPFFTGILLIRDDRTWRLMAALMLVTVLYLAVVAMGGSPRGDIPIIPLVVFAVALILKQGIPLATARAARDDSAGLGNWLTGEQRAVTAAGLVLIFLVGQFSTWLREDYAYVKLAELERQEFETVENRLIDDGIDHTKRVFADDFDLYFTRMRPWRPYHNGGWTGEIVHGFAAEYPDLAVSSPEAFLADCKRLGITHVVLSRHAERLGTDFGQIYAGCPHAAFQLVTESGRFRVFRIQPVDEPIDAPTDAPSASSSRGY